MQPRALQRQGRPDRERLFLHLASTSSLSQSLAKESENFETHQRAVDLHRGSVEDAGSTGQHCSRSVLALAEATEELRMCACLPCLNEQAVVQAQLRCCH